MRLRLLQSRSRVDNSSDFEACGGLLFFFALFWCTRRGSLGERGVGPGTIGDEMVRDERGGIWIFAVMKRIALRLVRKFDGLGAGVSVESSYYQIVSGDVRIETPDRRLGEWSAWPPGMWGGSGPCSCTSRGNNRS